MADRIDMALRLAQEGRVEGFRFIYERTWKEQYEKAVALLGNTEEAQTVVQQSYQFVFDHISEAVQGDVFGKWLSDTTAYYAIMQVRAREESVFAEPEGEDLTFRLEDDDMSFAEPADDAEISAVYDAKEIEEMLTGLMSSLTEAEKVCVVLHYQDNQSVDQVAQTIGCTQQAAEHFIASGKKKIMDATGLLEEEDERAKWKGIPFWLSLLRMKTTNLMAGGIASVSATFQIAGSAVTFGAAGTLAGSSVPGIAAGGAAAEAGTAGAAVGNGAAGVSAGGSATGAATAGSAIGKGFLHTLAGKLVIGVAAAAVVGGTAAGIAAYNHSHKKPDTAATNTDAETTAAAEQNSAAATDETTEQTTEQAVDETYKAVYLAVLRDHEGDLREYEVARHFYGDEQDDDTLKSVAIEDITGDDVPELIYIYSTGAGSSSVGTVGCTIYTLVDGKAREIFTDDKWDILAASGTWSVLFKEKDDDHLYLRKEAGDESWWTQYFRFDVQADGSLAMVQIADCSEKDRYAGDVPESQKKNEYTVDGQTATEAEYKKVEDTLTQGMSKRLQHNQIWGATYAEREDLSFDEAIALLSDGQPETQSTDGAVMPFSTAQTVRWWESIRSGTALTINPDGTFTGSYSGVSPTTPDRWGCEYHGKFKNIVQKDQFTYTMQLESLESDNTQDEWTETLNGVEYHYETTEERGIYDGTTFELYMPYTPIENLPQDYVDKLKEMYQLDSETVLPGYGFYNVEGNCAFLVEE